MNLCSWINRGIALLAVLFPAFFFFVLPSPAHAGILEIPGTGACEVLLSKVAEAFNAKHPGHRVVVPPSIGSSGGIRLVANDQAVLARVAQPVKDHDRASGLRCLVFARDMVVFAGGAKVTVRNLTKAQLADIYSGKIANWQELGGDPGPIRLLLREPGDSNLLIMQKHLPAFRNIAFPGEGKVITTDPKMLEMIKKYKYSIGWLTFSALKGTDSAIHPLSLDSIAPTPDNARSRKYQLIGDYALVFKEKRLNDLARSFLSFIYSQDCRRVMEQYGVIPVDKE